MKAVKTGYINTSKVKIITIFAAYNKLVKHEPLDKTVISFGSSGMFNNAKSGLIINNKLL